MSATKFLPLLLLAVAVCPIVTCASPDLRWRAMAATLTKAQRDELSDLTPGIPGGWNLTSSWNEKELRWEEDSQYQPNKLGAVGPRAILPIESARAAFRERVFKGMKWAKLGSLKATNGFVELPPGASIGKPYGGDRAVWDVYYKTTTGNPGMVVRGHVGGVEDQADSFTSRSLISVPEMGFRSDSGSGSSSPYTVYLVPHDMTEPVTDKDPALAPYAEYRERRLKDLAQRGAVPHASLDEPQAGFVKIHGNALLRWDLDKWQKIGAWEANHREISKGGVDPATCILRWPHQGNSGILYCFNGQYWSYGPGSLFGIGRTTDNLFEIGPLLNTEDHEAIRASLQRGGEYSASFSICPITAIEPWPRAVYDEDAVIGIAANDAEMRAYYGWDRK